ncbi:hypothetical protein [Candidatus Aalborgicola defluviihabitans]|jgi:hypothetical protein|uniref:hypothetical protein n=1 Tax=Candidatus Aalborgicola defluviihabitans TaxID=3386187 RepID=UPI001DA958D5|nr:hypothetical protein [Burkholderiales bacterium]MBK6569786.1 hypothetical protein [Burkholderiales bacterium]MBK7315512.1 hypothetical protein [Burkholderiales bacterium]MBL0242947.1 hypothetical protein [Rhodoferax sp.]
MFSGFLGKGKKPDGSTPKDAADSRGLEVREDDPDTSWGLWENAVAEQDSRFSALQSGDGDAPVSAHAYLRTEPLPLVDPDPVPPVSREERTMEQRKEDAMQVVELHHHRIANTIRTLWGNKECSVYISKLILSGSDDTGKARIGFNQEAADAMMVLADLHDALFGAVGPSANSAFSVKTGYDALR